MRLLECSWVDLVVLSNGAVNAEDHRLRFARQISNTKRPTLRSIRTLETYTTALTLFSPNVNCFLLAAVSGATA